MYAQDLKTGFNLKPFSIQAKLKAKFDCLIHEMSITQDLKQTLTVQLTLPREILKLQSKGSFCEDGDLI